MEGHISRARPGLAISEGCFIFHATLFIYIGIDPWVVHLPWGLQVISHLTSVI